MYRTIDGAFWRDPDIRSLSVTDRYLFLYLITCPHSHASGVFYLPLVTLVHETGLSITGAKRVIDTLSKEHLAFFDDQNEVFFVKSMFKYQGRGSKMIKAAANQLAQFGKSFLVNKFVEEYPEIREHFPIGYRYPIEGASEVGTLEQERKQKREQEIPPPTPPRG